MSAKMNIMLQFNPKQAGLELTEFYRCCVYRTKGNMPQRLSHGSIGVFYRVEKGTIIGEFEIIRIEEIHEPTTTDSESLYTKAFGYPITLYDGEYYGPVHFFFKNLKIYTPNIPFKEFNAYLNNKRRDNVGLPRGGFMYLDDEEVEFLRSQTSIIAVSDVINSKFINPYQL